MPATSEIEKLESRYGENPDGRYFAPLADAYRKVGRVDDAIQLVLKGLEKHPDYLSAHIVLGRCYLGKKDDAAAGQSFQTVLGLDAENIIALKSLAEIAERTGKPLEARQWLTKLLAVDSMNTEAEADLQRLGGPLPPPAEAEAPAVSEAAEDVSFADLAIAEAPTEPIPAIPEELAVGYEPTAPAAPAAEQPAASVWDAAPQLAEIPLEPAMPAAAPEAAEPLAQSDLPLIMPEDVTPPEELARPSAKMVQTVSPPLVEELVGTAPGGTEPMLTETMGDLYLRQGFRSEAADVYRRLLVQRPDDASLRAKLAQVEGPAPSLSAAALGAEPLGTWLRRVARAQLGVPPPPPPPPSSAPPSLAGEPSGEAGGPSPLEAAFAEAEPEVPGEPARPASDAFSLDQVFDAEPSAAGGAAAPAPPPPAGASFDEFFGAPPQEAESGRPEPVEGNSAPEGDPGSFSDWLRGLKR